MSRGRLKSFRESEGVEDCLGAAFRTRGSGVVVEVPVWEGLFAGERHLVDVVAAKANCLWGDALDFRASEEIGDHRSVCQYGWAGVDDD